MSEYKEELKLGARLVKEASRITEWFRKHGFESFTKSDESPVTLADLASQIFVVNALRKEYPDDQIIAEEDSSFILQNTEKILKECYESLNMTDIGDLSDILNYKGPKSNRQWTLDPIDGTEGYRNGLYYSIGLSFRDNNETKVCAICVPEYNNKGMAIFTALKNHGAFVSYKGNHNRPIAVSTTDKLEEFRMVHSLHYDEPWVEQFADMVGIQQRQAVDSMLKFCQIADSSADLYLKPIDRNHSYAWDYAPGDLLVKEAGGKVTTFAGAPLLFEDEKVICDTWGFIVSNGKLHDKVLEILRENDLVKEFRKPNSV